MELILYAIQVIRISCRMLSVCVLLIILLTWLQGKKCGLIPMGSIMH